MDLFTSDDAIAQWEQALPGLAGTAEPSQTSMFL